jgi:carnitine 3-dehydrogenase
VRPDDRAPLAGAEQMFVHVDAADRGASPATPLLLERIGLIAEAHSGLAWPDGAGRKIALRRRREALDG